MTKTTTEILSILLASGSIIISDSRSTIDLLTIARAAKRNGARVTIREDKPFQDMLAIARAGGGNVTFELS